MLRSVRGSILVLALLSILSLLLGSPLLAAPPSSSAPAATAGAEKPIWCQAGAESLAATTWPLAFTAQAELWQQSCGQPGCSEEDTELGICTAKGKVRYDWGRRSMVTEYDPCLPLITPTGGSAYSCSFHFLSGDLYYLYRDQHMVVGTAHVNEASCCVIPEFPMLSPSFPAYVEQYGQSCDISVDETVRMYSQAMTYLLTPGVPPGFYGYYPEVTDPAGAGPDSYAMPYGFGGATPGGFTQISYQAFDANPDKNLPFVVPTLCQDAPNCTMRNPIDPKQIIPIGAFLKCLLPAKAGGCALCHTPRTEIPFEGNFPCCPGEVWSGTACQETTPGSPLASMPPALETCLKGLASGGSTGR